jgi:hypothetical protein
VCDKATEGQSSGKHGLNEWVFMHEGPLGVGETSVS